MQILMLDQITIIESTKRCIGLVNCYKRCDYKPEDAHITK